MNRTDKPKMTSKELVDKLIDKSILLNPFNVMLKGYTMIEQDEKIIKSIDEVDLSKNMDVLMHDGLLEVKPISIKEKK